MMSGVARRTIARVMEVFLRLFLRHGKIAGSRIDSAIGCATG
jgi:hypothetical protein